MFGRRPRLETSRLETVLAFLYEHGIPAMTKSAADLTAAVKAQTDATAALTKAVTDLQNSGAGAPADFTPQVDALTASASATADAAKAIAALASVPVAITITPTTIDAAVGSMPSTQLVASGGTAPYTFSTSSPFSTGSSLTSDGLFNAPTTAGTDTLEVTATDSTGATGTASVTFTAA
jgi:hypothetical protein